MEKKEWMKSTSYNLQMRTKLDVGYKDTNQKNSLAFWEESGHGSTRLKATKKLASYLIL